MTKKKAARRTKTSVAAITRAENGHKKPSYAFIDKLAKGLDVPREDLIWFAKGRRVRESRDELFDAMHKLAVKSLCFCLGPKCEPKDLGL